MENDVTNHSLMGNSPAPASNETPPNSCGIGEQESYLTRVPPVMIPVCQNNLDEAGNPSGGSAFGPGFCISWQNGPLGRPEDELYPRLNGAFVEAIIRAVINRIRFYQNSRFACEENSKAEQLLSEALIILESRRNRRVSEGTYGTNEGK